MDCRKPLIFIVHYRDQFQKRSKNEQILKEGKKCDYSSCKILWNQRQLGTCKKLLIHQYGKEVIRADLQSQFRISNTQMKTKIDKRKTEYNNTRAPIDDFFCSLVSSNFTRVSFTEKRGNLDAIMNHQNDASCLDRLQREALTCLNGFPNKVRALNDIIANYAPEVIKKSVENTTRNVPEIPLTEKSVTEELNSANSDEASNASVSNLDKSVSRGKTSKKKHHHIRRLNKKIKRHRQGPLSHILRFLSKGLAVCTKATVMKPSKYIANHALTMLRDTLIQRERLIHVRCGPSTIWSLSKRRLSSLELRIDLGSTVDNFIGIMRPAAAQLIADTTKLKRWFQALTVTFAPATPLLIHAIRRTEAIDVWAYELYFHLKYLQENRIRNVEKKSAMGFNVIDDVSNTNLWHRLVQLRDNYVFLYETLYNNDQYRKFSRELTELIR